MTICLNENERLLPECPCCKHQFFDRVGEVIITPIYLIIGDEGKPMTSLPKIVCLDCGCEFFPPQSLAEIKKNTSKQSNLIMVPKVGIN